MLLYALAALSGLLQVLVFPSFSIGLLAPFAVAPLLVAVDKAESRKQRFLLGWLCGAIYWGGACYWIFFVMRDYAYLAAPAAGAIYLAFLAAKGLHLAVFSVAVAPLLKRTWAVPAVAALWVAVEGTHQYLGFTWLHLGNAAASMSVLAPLAPFTGVYGPSFVLAALNVALALAVLRRPRTRLYWLAALPLLLLLPALPENETGDQTVRLLQPNLHPDRVIDGWDQPESEAHSRRMFELSSAPATPRPDLIVWPEYSAPRYYFDSARDRQITEALAQATQTPFIFNTIAFTEIDGRRRPLNSAVVLDSDGRLASRYSKRFLVPFGEFVPWPFSLFIAKITLAAGDFYPGDQASVAEIDGKKIGVYICYENVFARGVRDFVQNGAEVLVNISNDAWYGRTSARYQHLLIARMRAIENQRYILRSTADGITTVINRAGQIHRPPPSFEEAVLDAPFAYHGDLTLFTRWGEWFWGLCSIAALFALGHAALAPSARN